jgi:hypothetical protein
MSIVYLSIFLALYRRRENPVDQRQLAIIAVFGVGAWVAWLIFSAVRQYMAACVKSAAQDKLLRCVNSPESLKEFLASEAGGRFLRSLEEDPKEPWHGIIRNVQTAVVFGVGGITMLISHLLYREVIGLLAFAVGGLAAAVAFGLSAAVSLALHRHAGILPSNRD